MSTTEIFDIININDLPPELKKELGKRQTSSLDEKIIALLLAANALTYDKILIGLYRKYGIIKKRAWLGYRLFVLTKKGRITKIGKGTYKIVLK